MDRITGHGGLFKTPGVGQRILAAALYSPISVMETAGEGGAWGIALLAAYVVNNADKRSLAEEYAIIEPSGKRTLVGVVNDIGCKQCYAPCATLACCLHH